MWQTSDQVIGNCSWKVIASINDLPCKCTFVLCKYMHKNAIWIHQGILHTCWPLRTSFSFNQYVREISEWVDYNDVIANIIEIFVTHRQFNHLTFFFFTDTILVSQIHSYKHTFSSETRTQWIQRSRPFWHQSRDTWSIIKASALASVTQSNLWSVSKIVRSLRRGVLKKISHRDSRTSSIPLYYSFGEKTSNRNGY